MTEFLSTQEAAERVGFHRDVIVREIKRGRLRASKRCGRWIIAVEWLEDWITAGVTAAPAPATARGGGGHVGSAAGGSFRQRARRGPP